MRWLDDEGLSLDVCTAGELGSRCAPGSRRSGSPCTGPTSRLRRTGDRPCTPSIGAIVIDSFHEIARLAGLAEHRPAADADPGDGPGHRGVEAHTHEFIATAHEDQKFGFSLAGGDAAEAVRRVRRAARAAL